MLINTKSLLLIILIDILNQYTILKKKSLLSSFTIIIFLVVK